MSHADPFKSQGLINKYLVTRSDGRPIDEGAEYFVLRLDAGGKDPLHVAACRAAVLEYARQIRQHLPVLAEELTSRYSPETQP